MAITWTHFFVTTQLLGLVVGIFASVEAFRSGKYSAAISLARGLLLGSLIGLGFFLALFLGGVLESLIR